jgi:hypothetical protein
MAWDSRKASNDVVVLSVGGSDILATFRDVTDDQSVAEIDAGAVMDTYVVLVPGRKTRTVSVTVAVEDEPYVKALVGTNVAFTANLAGTATSGTALLTKATHATGGVDGAQTCAFDLKVQTTS